MELIKPHGSTPGSLRNRTGRVSSGQVSSDRVLSGQVSLRGTGLISWVGSLSLGQVAVHGSGLMPLVLGPVGSSSHVPKSQGCIGPRASASMIFADPGSVSCYLTKPVEKSLVLFASHHVSVMHTRAWARRVFFSVRKIDRCTRTCIEIKSFPRPIAV